MNQSTQTSSKQTHRFSTVSGLFLLNLSEEVFHSCRSPILIFRSRGLSCLLEFTFTSSPLLVFYLNIASLPHCFYSSLPSSMLQFMFFSQGLFVGLHLKQRIFSLQFLLHILQKTSPLSKISVNALLAIVLVSLKEKHLIWHDTDERFNVTWIWNLSNCTSSVNWTI